MGSQGKKVKFVRPFSAFEKIQPDFKKNLMLLVGEEVYNTVWGWGYFDKVEPGDIVELVDRRDTVWARGIIYSVTKSGREGFFNQMVLSQSMTVRCGIDIVGSLEELSKDLYGVSASVPRELTIIRMKITEVLV